MATIGRGSAVAVLGKRHFSGLFAWLLWLFIHLMKLARFENRMLVLLQWGWHYTTWNQAARLITMSPLIQSGSEMQRPSTAQHEKPHVVT